MRSTSSIRFFSPALCLAFLLVACGGNVAILPDEIQLQASEAAEDATALLVQPEVVDASSEAPGLPAIRLGNPDFHASNPDSFQIASGRTQMVEFFAYWCAVCKAMAPTVHGLEGMYSDRVQFVYLDRDDPATSVFQEQLGYIYQPHFFLIDPGGNVLAQWRGYVDGAELQQALLAAVGN